MKLYAWSFAVLGPALLVPSAAAAQSSPPAMQPLTRANFIATMDSEYRKLDTNKDGIVTRPEIDGHQQRLAASAAAERARAAFTLMDTDRNGQLSAEEFMRSSVAQPTKSDGSAVMARLDANRDQKVTLVEYRTLTLTNFDRLDADKDGLVSVVEQRAGGLAR